MLVCKSVILLGGCCAAVDSWHVAWHAALLLCCGHNTQLCQGEYEGECGDG
jgi:hypothetical protein